ncbi:MAG: PepSY-associated TM helix domain-containing protein [Acidobacteria bacterium]|nr:PepSY-associated TM helix domain-containing protein [Acidobacteriota bacterium]MBI3487152.1 PepSY-associated TM helix domain-containing protein [Acidobacteriota bacterium]
MSATFSAGLQRWNRILHRDAGYFLTAFVIVYCLSGIALNHIHEWNPDFIIQKRTIPLERVYTESEVGPELANALAGRVGEGAFRIIDVPTPGQVKIYFDNAFLQLHLAEQQAVYERVVRRPLIYDANIMHRNSLRSWRWFSDAFSVLLILVNVTGLFLLKGRHGLGARGKWLILAGAVPPLAAVVAFRLL